MSSSSKNFRLRSFVRRDGRMTPAQQRAYVDLKSAFGLQLDEGPINNHQVFGRHAPLFLEVGFGSGQSLLAVAQTNLDKDFIGVETHKPGIGAVLLGMHLHAIKNIRVYDNDVIDVFEQCIAEASLHGVQIFFPDPWPKRRHHPRRLIQVGFVRLIVEKLKIGGTLHLATDWADYACQMMQVLSQEKRLINLAGCNQYADRSPYRPIFTKFEHRALREGRHVHELQFVKHAE